MAMIPKARKKSESEISLLRTKYQKHLFEIKEGVFLTIDTYNDLAEAFNKAAGKSKSGFMYKGKWFTTDYAAFCLHRYDNIDPSYDEQMLEYYAKRLEDAKKGKVE